MPMMNNLPVVTLKLHRTNKQRLKVFYEGEPVQGLDGNPSIAVRQHYHLLRGEMDDDLIAGVITALAALESVVEIGRASCRERV